MTAPDRLPPGQQLAAPDKWPVVGEHQPAPMVGPWSVNISGLVKTPRTWTLEELQQMPQVERSIDIHCVTRWSKLDMRFRGVLLAEIMELAAPLPSAEFLSFVAHSERKHSTSLPLRTALQLDALLAFEADGEPISSQHGGPIRVVVPGKYFYKSLKWLTEIRVLPEEELGFWEGKAGYHNHADPWLEQRYVSPNLNRMQVAKAFTQRNFVGIEFQSLEASGINLPELNATGAVLRNADFRRARLRGANFTAANLSNAHFEGADVRGACFRDADVEGADFAVADLRGCDFRGASLLGATFHRPAASTFSAAAIDENPAEQFDVATRFDADQLDQLSPEQASYVRSLLSRLTNSPPVHPNCLD